MAELASVLDPVLGKNPALAMRDWRFNETEPDDGTARQLEVQYRSSQDDWVTVYALNLTAAITAGDLLYASAAGILSRLGKPSSDSYLLGVANGLPAWIASSGIGIGGWATAYEVDFTAQSTQDLKSGGDGAKTIAGKTWTVANTAGATTFGVTNGTGIVIERNSADPTLYAKFADLTSTINIFENDIEIWLRLTNAQVSTSFEWALAGIFTPPDGNQWAVQTGHRFGTDKTPNDHWLTLAHYNTADVSFGNSPVTSTALTDDVIVMRLYDQTRGAFWSGTYSSGWPTFASLTPRGIVQTYTIPQPDPTKDPTPNNACVFMTCSGGNTKMTVTHMRVRVRQ